MSFDFQRLITDAQSPEDNIRKEAEACLLELCDADASQLFLAFMNIAMNANELLSSRQFALFSLRKLITMYWSPGFQSYRDTSSLSGDSKAFIKKSLLQLSLDDTQLSKLKNAASYCIVQISATDFPDQWPELLSVIYNSIQRDHSLAAMSLLNEIYDDVISEEMFFEEGIGLETIRIVFQVLTDHNSSLEAHIAALNLCHSCLLQMVTVDSSATAKRKEMIVECLKEAFQIWGQLLQQYTITDDLLSLTIKAKVYQDLALLKTEFPRKLFPSIFFNPFKDLALNDLEATGNICVPIFENDATESQLEMVNEGTIHVIEFLTSICDIKFNFNDLIRVALALQNLCCLDTQTVQLFLEDFNCFISTETGLVASYSIRDQTTEFLASLNSQSHAMIFEIILQQLSKNDEENWRVQESLLYLLQSVITNDASPSEDVSNQMADVIKFLDSMLDSAEILRSRTILVIPKLLAKFVDSLVNVKMLTKYFLIKSLEIAQSTADQLSKASVLIAITYYVNFAELPSVLGRDVCDTVQKKTLNLITELSHEAEDDTYGVLMEGINHVIDCNSAESFKLGILEMELQLVLKISVADPSNVQTVVESQDCLEKLLQNLDTEKYTICAEVCLPLFLKLIQDTTRGKTSYSSLLSLTLQFLTVLLKHKPFDGHLPPIITSCTFQPLQGILLHSDEDEELQLATEAFSYLVYNTEHAVMAPYTESIIIILDRLLSCDVSDTAAMHVGSLIITLFTQFSGEIQTMIPVILQATTERFIKAKNISTSQNLLSVFCYLMSLDAQQTVDFLYTIDVDNGKGNGLFLVISKWLEAFEVIRGERRTKENILALSHLYFLNDPRLADMTVNGDIIPYQGEQIITRSKAKDMPDKYTQISIYAKITKLFVAELSFQDRQQDPERFITGDLEKGTANRENDGEENADEWEDVEDVLDYEKLQEYVDDSDEYGSEEEPSGDIPIGFNLKQSITELLVEFFKEAAAKNASGFQGIYDSLSKNEKTVLSENLV